jgi:hydrogenase-4 component B
MTTEPLLLLMLPLALIVPLAMTLLGLVRPVRRHLLSLLPVAPLPALAAALLVPREATFVAPDLLLGLRLSLDANGAMFLGMSALLWTAAGVYARTYMPSRGHPVRFAAFWCLTLAGNLGVFVAADAATFYTAFACMSLAAYPLIVHDENGTALRAGRIYIILAIIGEACLLLGVLIGVSSADSLAIADIRAAIPGSDLADGAVLLFVLGFGIKAGLVPLHVWLPLAHPAAPTPASAVLSGAIVKAGIFGLIQFLPAGAVLPLWSDLLVGVGILTAYYGVIVGVTQSHPKTILAYSTMSQMGLVVAVIGTAMAADPAPGALAAASLYAVHHGLAKGALFMGAGVAAAAGGRAIRPVLAALALPAFAVAGLPLTGGALSKLAIKDPFAGELALLLVAVSAVGTALLMIKFLIAARAAAAPEADARPPMGLWAPWLATVFAALLLPWLLYAGVTGQAVLYPLTPANLWDALWPIALAVFLALIALRVVRFRIPAIPEGDLVVPVTAGIEALARLPRPRPRPLPAEMLRTDWRFLARALDMLEHVLARWSVAGAILLLVIVGAALAG